MKIALAVARIINKDIDYNLSQMKKYIIQAKNKNADLICFGETFLQGFDCFCWNYQEDCQMAISSQSPLFQQICELSHQWNIDILFGYGERDENHIYSSCALIVEGKLHYNYRRISQGWKEVELADEHYQEGKDVGSFLYQGKKCVIGLCGDVWNFPERFALKEDLLFWPVYVSWSKEQWENECKQDYARQAYLCCDHTLYFNSLCDGDTYGAAAYFQKGSVAQELPIGQEGLLIVDI